MSKDFDEFLNHAQEDMIPKMRGSVMSLTIWNGTVDAKICIEFGAAILLDKPILVVAKRDCRIPVNLKRCASRIVEIDFEADDPRSQTKIHEALLELLANDERCKKKAEPLKQAS